MPLDKDLKERWIAALRSGEYKQGRRALQRRECNCCLGVLARIEGVEPGEVDTFFDYGSVFDFGNGNYSAIMPPPGFVGLDYHEMQKLADLNDRGFTFNQIADYIEENM